MNFLIVLAVILAIVSIGIGTFWVLVQLGVIVHEAAKPPHHDTNDYRLSQGRDIGEKHEG